MKALVIGGAGYIGSHFVRFLIEKAHEVDVYDNLSLGHKKALDPKAGFFEADLLDEGALGDCLQMGAYDAVFHFAANALVGESVENPSKYYKNNVEGVRVLLESLRRVSPKSVLVFSSSCAVFGIPEKLPISEDSRKAPISPYGRSKLVAEYMLEDYALAYGLRTMALRYFNASGAHASGDIGEDHQPETHLIPNVLKSVLGQKQLKIFGSDFPTTDGSCLRDYIHVMDLARAHLLAAEHLLQHKDAHFDAIHLGSGRAYSNLEICRAVEEIVGKNLSYEIAPARAGDPPALFADVSKARQVLGFQTECSDLETIIASAWKWHEKYPEGFVD